MAKKMKQCNILIHAGLIITQNKNREILENCSIAIKDGIIAEIGDTGQMKQVWFGDNTLNYQEKLVMPGLINAHTHAAMTFLRGFADDLPLMDWLNNCIFPAEKELTHEIVYLGSLLGYAEMLSTGTTACIDMYIFEDAVFKAAETAGLRCLGGEALFAFPSAAFSSFNAALEETERLADKYKNHSRLKVAVNPHSVYTTNSRILKETARVAKKLELPVHIHLAETKEETEESILKHGMRPVQWCKSNGLFDCRLVLAHMVDLNSREMTMLAKADITAVHNPASNMKLASGAAQVPKMQKKGIAVALGTDGPASNNSLNMFCEMSRAALLHKVVLRNPTEMPASLVLDMATLNGAKAFGNINLGKIETGCPADCIALDLHSPGLLPVYNPVSLAVYAASGHEVRMTMAEGEILYEDGRFTRFDYSALLKEIKTLRSFAIKHYKR